MRWPATSTICASRTSWPSRRPSPPAVPAPSGSPSTTPVGSNARTASPRHQFVVPVTAADDERGDGRMLVLKRDRDVLEVSRAMAVLVGYLGAEAVAEPEQLSLRWTRARSCRAR